MTAADSLSVIRRRRPAANPIPSFRALLDTFEVQWKSTTCNTCDGTSIRNGGYGPMPQQETLSASKRAASIGPELPPSHVAKSNDGDVVDDLNVAESSTNRKKRDSSAGVSTATKRSKTIIGPSLAPP